MKLSQLLSLLGAAAIAPFASAVEYNQSITAIYGSGNPSGGWTTDSGDRGLLLGLRAKNRTNGSTTNVNGTYSFATAPATRGLWNYEFSIGSGDLFLDAYDYFLSVDRDSSQGVSFSTIDPLSYWFDNSFGTGATLSGQGVEGVASNFVDDHTVAQNSQNITFGNYPIFPMGALPLEANATYTYELFAVAKGSGIDGSRLASVSIDVVVGQGGARVPDAASTAGLLGAALAGLAFVRNRRRR